MDAGDLVLLPWDEARRVLGDRAHAMRVLVPPYPAEGEGALRVRDDGEGPLDVTCGFERYRRTGAA
jgi:hypothetical protein